MDKLKRFYSKFLKANQNIILVTFIVILFSVLRFVNLGYSDFTSDEFATCLYKGGKQDTQLTKTEYLLSQRKGPLQIAVGAIPDWLYGCCKNELAQRIPFALFSVLSLVVLFYTVLKITKSSVISFLAVFIFGVNGLVSAYGRIAQYQNLNTLFSFAALYFFADLLGKDKNHTKSVILGAAMFGLSFLAHWDAFYVLLPIAFIFVSYFATKTVLLKEKLRIFALSVIVASVFILPFLIPYLLRISQLPENVDYAENIIGFAKGFVRDRDVFQFKVYNPLFALYFYVVFGVLGIYFSKKNIIFNFWFLIIVVIFGLFIKYSGLHFYNIFVPWAVLISYALVGIPKLLPKVLKIFWWSLVICLLTFLYIQTYVLFVDHKVEYPVERETVLFWKTPEIENPGLMRHKTGFTHKRYWREINDFITSYNFKLGENLPYITNEYGAHVKYYMSIPQDRSSRYYAIGIKRPLSLSNDYKFSQIHNKETIHIIEDDDGSTVVRIYLVGKDD